MSISSTVSSSSTTVKRLSSKLNKRYTSKFKQEWLSMSQFSSFLRECKTDGTKALCIVCNVQFSIRNSGLGDIKYHIGTNKHKQSTKAVEANPSNVYDFELFK